MINIKKNILLSTLLIASCNQEKVKNKVYYPLKQCNNQNSDYTKYQKCDLEDIKDYYDVIVDNSKKSNKVLLWIEGGPIITSPGADYKKSINDHYVPLSAKNEGISFYLMNQSQYLKQNKFLDGNIDQLTYEDGYKEHMETVDNVHKVIKHLKKQNKIVGLVGHSYGSFVVNEYLAKYGDDTPDFVLSAAGRLKINNAKNLQKAYEIAFTKEHSRIFIKENDTFDDSANDEEVEKLDFLNGLIIQNKIGLKGLLKDYTKAIKDKDLSKTTFLTANPDYLVGWFNQEEINWAKSRNAKIEAISKEETARNYQQNVIDGNDYSPSLEEYAHSVGIWTWEQVLRYYINAFNK